MPDQYTITLTDAPDPQDASVVREGLAQYSRAHVGETSFRPLTLFVRDANDALLGGLLGGTYWAWLHVDILWLSEALRHQGYGTRLLHMAEQEAIVRGCHGVHLDTMSFQALPFYQRRGYTIFGELADIPPGHRRYFLHKSLLPDKAAQATG